MHICVNTFWRRSKFKILSVFQVLIFSIQIHLHCACRFPALINLYVICILCQILPENMPLDKFLF